MAWAQAIHSSGLETMKRPGGSRFKSHYLGGARTPSTETIVRVDSDVPETLAFHNSPIWKLLSLEEIRLIQPIELFELLPSEIRMLWVRDNWVNNDWTELLLWRRRKPVADELTDVRNAHFNKKQFMDAFICVTILIHEAIYIQDSERLRDCLNEWAIIYKYVYDNDVGFMHHALYSDATRDFGAGTLFHEFGTKIFSMLKNINMAPDKNSTSYQLFGTRFLLD